MRRSTRPATAGTAALGLRLSRTVFAEVPPRVEYAITQKARGLGPTMEALTAWWKEYGQSVPVKPASRGRKAKVAKSKAG